MQQAQEIHGTQEADSQQAIEPLYLIHWILHSNSSSRVVPEVKTAQFHVPNVYYFVKSNYICFGHQCSVQNITGVSLKNVCDSYLNVLTYIKTQLTAGNYIHMTKTRRRVTHMSHVCRVFRGVTHIWAITGVQRVKRWWF